METTAPSSVSNARWVRVAATTGVVVGGVALQWTGSASGSSGVFSLVDTVLWVLIIACIWAGIISNTVVSDWKRTISASKKRAETEAAHALTVTTEAEVHKEYDTGELWQRVPLTGELPLVGTEDTKQ